MLAFALAGCSGAGGDAAGDEPPAGRLLDSEGQPILAATAANATPAPTTDTLHLRPAARLNATPLANLTLLAQLAGATAQAFNWNATLNGTGNVSFARLRLWIDLQSSALQPGVNGDPACTAHFTLYATRNGTVAAQAGGCASLGRVSIPPGEHLLEFSTPLTAFPGGLVLGPGDKLLVQVAFGFSFPQGHGWVLGGGDRDSALVLDGLAEPVVGVL